MCREVSTTKDDSVSGVRLLGAAAMGAMALGAIGVGVLSVRKLMSLEDKVNELHATPRTRVAVAKRPRFEFAVCEQAAGVHRDPVTGLPDECNP